VASVKILGYLAEPPKWDGLGQNLGDWKKRIFAVGMDKSAILTKE